MCLKDKILNCQNCELYKNQLPLLDAIQEADVMWVGISAKKVGKKKEEPLAVDTNTGIIIRNIICLLNTSPSQRD